LGSECPATLYGIALKEFKKYCPYFKIGRSSTPLENDDAGYYDEENKQIMLSPDAGCDTFFHEIGHAMFDFRYIPNLHLGTYKCSTFTEEVAVRIFEELMLTGGDMELAEKNSRAWWDTERHVWYISYYAKMPESRARRVRHSARYNPGWMRAKKIALKMYNSGFGQLLAQMYKEGARLGV
jgi:hypothetical protein